MEDRDHDKKFFLVPESGSSIISLDVLKSAFIAEGLSSKEIASRYFLKLEKVEEIIESHKLVELRKAYMVQGLKNIQNTQIQQSRKLMDLDNDFKKLRILQLEAELKDFLVYYERHGDFYKRHPMTGEVLKDTNGIPMQIKIPSVTKEINQLKESVTMSEGVKSMLNRIDEIINTGKPKENIYNKDGGDVIIDADFSELFKDAGDD